VTQFPRADRTHTLRSARARGIEFGIALAIALQLALLLALAARLGTWIDEEYALASTGHGIATALVRAQAVEQQPPLYFVLEAAWRTLNPSVFFARLPSVLCAGALTLVAAGIARRLWPESNPLWFAVAIAFNPFVIYAGLEVRAYALALLVSGLTWLTFYDGFMCEGRRRSRVWFVAFAIAGTYTQYFLALALPACALTLAVGGRWKALLWYLTAVLGVAIACVPLALSASHQANVLFPETRPWPVVAERWLTYPWTEFLFPASFGSSFSGRRIIFLRALALLAAGAILLARPRPGRRTWGLIAGAAAIEFGYVAIATGLRIALVAPRHFVALFVPLWAAACGILASLTAPRRRAFVTFAAALYAVATALALATEYRNLAKYGDWPRVGAYLEEHAGARDTIVGFPAEVLWPIARYEHGPAALVPLPRPLSFTRYRLDDLTLNSVNEAEIVLRAPLARGTVWLVTNPDCGPLPTFGCEYLEQALKHDARVVARRLFSGTLVRELAPLRPRSGTAAAH